MRHTLPAALCLLLIRAAARRAAGRTRARETETSASAPILDDPDCRRQRCVIVLPAVRAPVEYPHRILKYAGEVVVILMGAGKMTVGEGLAAAIEWPIVSCDEPRALRAIVERALGRREHRVIASTPLSAADQAMVRGTLHRVRFVDLTDQHGAVADIVGAIRRDFGI